MSKLLITTQVHENYGAHDWDGQGECPQYWKAKGGNDYFLMIDGFRPEHAFADKNLQMIVDGVRGQIEQDNHAFREYILDWEIVADDYLTEFEQSQLQYEGKITYGAKVLAW
jgi:hypothetical protein